MLALVFPGQGSQKVGMGKDLHEQHAQARELFDRAEQTLGLPLRRLCFEGPEEELTATENAQPALYCVSAICLAILRERGVDSELAAGHSLGEYSALYAAGVWSFEAGLRAVRRRGELMAGVAATTPGRMAAVLGLPLEQVEAACSEAAALGVVEIANRNAPDQTVISGEAGAVDEACRLLRERGARRVLPLNVSAPFHCSLMAPIAEEMGQVLLETPMEPPCITVIANVTGEPVREVEEVRAALRRQMAGSVRWVETVSRLAQEGARGTIEVGPGRVLTGLTPRIVPGMGACDTATALAGEML